MLEKKYFKPYADKFIWNSITKMKTTNDSLSIDSIYSDGAVA
jgi:hypothetical protein